MSRSLIILHGGTVLTMDGARPTDAATRAADRPGVPDAAGRRASAICIAGDIVLAVGTDAEILALAEADSTVVDLAGRAILPGFVDPHAHPYWEGTVATRPSLEDAPDLRAAMRALPGAGEHLEPDAWIVARYNQARWLDGRHPTRDDLDRAVPDRPVVLAHVSGHAAVANSLALALAGITAATPDRPGAAVLLRDSTGEPTGVIEGTEAWAALAHAMPLPGPGEVDVAMRVAAARLAADGVTWVADADLGSVMTLEHELAAYGDAVARGTFPLGLSLMPGLVHLAPRPDDDPPTPADVMGRLPAAVRAAIVVRHVKLKADGALTTRTAWLMSPYADAPGHAGRPVHEPAALVERVRRAARAGWGVATHAIGDAGVVAVLDAYDAADAATDTADTAAGAVPHAAHRVEHGMLLEPAVVARLAARPRPIVAQPEFTAWAGDIYLRRLGEARAGRLLPYAELLAARVPLAFSSDRPVVAGAPLAGIRAALAHDAGISVAEALHAWTATAASVAGADRAGVLAAGRRADLVILPADPTAIPATAWAGGADGLVVVATFAGGRLVHGAIDGLRTAEPEEPGRPRRRRR
jgi:predicted amidohydrolase YtcJ